jgi:protein involved in polysaccharide export with SLBB domain
LCIFFIKIINITLQAKLNLHFNQSKQNMNFIKIIFSTTILFFLSNSLHAQDLFKRADISTVNVDNLPDSDIQKIKSQLASNKMTIDQAEPLAISKGMKQSEFLKLKSRIASLTSNDSNVAVEQATTLKQETVSNAKRNQSLNNNIFGSELFTNPNLSFEPNLKLATPLNYILGPDDDLQISIYGVQEFNTAATVNSEGKISIPFVGQISVAGMTIEAATQKIKNACAKIYSTVNSGKSKVSVSLSKIRTIKVTIIGGNQPGNYAVSSLSTVYNALHICGGPGANGSFRNIELIRSNKVIRKIDLYRFLVNGDQSDNLGLRDEDVIRIPAYSQRVVLEGEVKRPGIFEMQKDETFANLLNFASGFNEYAYTATISVIQKTNKEFKVVDLRENQFAAYKINSGDTYTVSKILNRFENRIKIDGAVFRPNNFAFKTGMRVTDLINQADGLKEDAYRKRAKLVRLKSDLSLEVLNIDLEQAFETNSEANILLNKEDILTIYSIFDFIDQQSVSIKGEVRRPGTYDFVENLTLNDLLLRVGGITDMAAKKVEVARLIKSDVVDDSKKNKIELIQFDIDNQTNEQLQNFKLKPFDVINIRKIAVYEKAQEVQVQGAFLYPGFYALENKTEKVSNIINRAGGVLKTANIKSMKVKRPITTIQIADVENVNLNLGEGDTAQDKIVKKLKEETKYSIIPIHWEKIANNEGESTNITLFPGDIIEILTFNEGVKVTGNVLLTSEIPYQKGKGFNYYFDAVGGLDYKAWKKRSYIIYPNGKAAAASSFLFFRSYPKVEPGSQIVVPERPEKIKTSATEVIGFASILASLAGLIVAVLR